jgi:hypothetical protein
MPAKKKSKSKKRVVVKHRKTHNPALKLTMRRKGSRLVHGYETASRKKKRR